MQTKGGTKICGCHDGSFLIFKTFSILLSKTVIAKVDTALYNLWWAGAGVFFNIASNLCCAQDVNFTSATIASLVQTGKKSTLTFKNL